MGVEYRYMAEEKKPSGAVAKGAITNSEATERTIYILATFLILGAIISAVSAYLKSLGLDISNMADYFLNNIWPTWKLVAAIVSALALAGILHNSWKLRAINLEEQKIYGALPGLSIPDEDEVIEPKNAKWEKVIKLMSSDNASDWRLAIIEADVILEELLHATGYEGESVGEMLKSVEKSDFLTIEDAWEAHKVRNAVAHSGGDFQLNERETRRIVGLFEKVFKEFDVI